MKVGDKTCDGTAWEAVAPVGVQVIAADCCCRLAPAWRDKDRRHVASNGPRGCVDLGGPIAQPASHSLRIQLPSVGPTRVSTTDTMKNRQPRNELSGPAARLAGYFQHHPRTLLVRQRQEHSAAV